LLTYTMKVRKAFKLLFRDYLGDPEQHYGVIVLVNTSTSSYHVTWPWLPNYTAKVWLVTL